MNDLIKHGFAPGPKRANLARSDRITRAVVRQLLNVIRQEREIVGIAIAENHGAAPARLDRMPMVFAARKSRRANRLEVPGAGGES